MRKLFFLSFLFIGCQGQSDNPSKDEDLQKQTYISLIDRYGKEEADEIWRAGGREYIPIDEDIKKAIRNRGTKDSIQYEEKKRLQVELAPKSIRIVKAYTDDPNSAGGVDVNIVWKNLSDKTVKYATFIAEPYNAVGDVVSSSIGGDVQERLQVTGPITPGQTYGYTTSWGTVWYNHTIKSMKIVGVELQYMEGDTLTFDTKEALDLITTTK